MTLRVGSNQPLRDVGADAASSSACCQPAATEAQGATSSAELDGFATAIMAGRLEASLNGASASQPKPELALEHFFERLGPIFEQMYGKRESASELLNEALAGGGNLPQPQDMGASFQQLMIALIQVAVELNSADPDPARVEELLNIADKNFLDWASQGDPAVRAEMARQYGSSASGGGAFGNSVPEGLRSAQGSAGGGTSGAPVSGNYSGDANGEGAMQIALGEVGVREASGNNDGVPAQRYSNGQEEPWCANFVAWAFEQAGTPLPGNQESLGSTDYMADQMKAVGAYHASKSGYEPQPGDIIFFGEAGDMSHVGIVTGYDAATGTVTTVEGNSGNQVAQGSYNINDSYVQGFANP